MSFFEFPHTRTYDSDLGWLIKTVKKVCEEVENLDTWKVTHEEEYNQLKALYDAIMAGNFPEEVVNAFNKWATTNLPELLQSYVAAVFFGITEDGYFFADIPEAWNEIIFNTTGYDILISDTDFGHLTLTY